MKLRWPISPWEESRVRSLFSSRAPPLRPPTHSSLSFSRFSSNNLAMLTRGMRLPVGYQLMQLRGAAGCEQALAERFVAEHLRQLGEDLQVHVGCTVGHQQHED